MIAPIQPILARMHRRVDYLTDGIEIYNEKIQKRTKLVIYPAMWHLPKEKGVLFVSDGYIACARPYAVERILKNT